MEYDDRPGADTRAPWSLAALVLSMLLSSLGTSVVNVALPTLAEEFEAPFGQVQWVVLAYLLALTATVVSAGRLGDIAGRRRVLMLGLAVVVGASALGATAPSLLLVVAARVAQGVGAALVMALSLAIVADAVPRARTGAAMGLMGTASALGTALGPALGGAAIAVAGWRAIFLVNIPVGVVAFALVRRHLPRDRAHGASPRPDLDPVGTVLLALALVAYCLAMTTAPGSGRIAALGLLALAAGMAGAFVRSQLRAPTPLVELRMLRGGTLASGLATGAIVSVVIMATLVVGPFYLSRALGLDAGLVGIAMSVGPAVVVIAGVPAGRLVDRVGANRLVSAGLVAMAAGSGLLAAVPLRLGIAGYVVPMVVLTLGYATFQAANNAAVMAAADEGRRGVTSGLLSLARNLGLITGASLMGAVFTIGSGTARLAGAPPASVAAGLHVTFGLAAALIGLALAIASGARRAARLPAA